MKKFFLHDGLDQVGPYGFEELKQKNITKDTNVWSEGMDTWTKADKIEELKGLFDSIPPPFTSEKKSPPPLTNPSAILTNENISTNNKKTKTLLFTIIGVFLILGCFATYFLVTRNLYGSGSGDYYQNVMSVEDTERSIPANFLTDKSTYRPAVLGNKWVIEGTITNNATIVTYKNIVLRIIFYGENGSELGSNEYSVNNRIAPYQTIEYKAKLEGFEGTESIGVSVNRADY